MFSQKHVGNFLKEAKFSLELKRGRLNSAPTVSDVLSPNSKVTFMCVVPLNDTLDRSTRSPQRPTDATYMKGSPLMTTRHRRNCQSQLAQKQQNKRAGNRPWVRCCQENPFWRHARDSNRGNSPQRKPRPTLQTPRKLPTQRKPLSGRQFHPCRLLERLHHSHDPRDDL